jgi:hypothetical protein
MKFPAFARSVLLLLVLSTQQHAFGVTNSLVAPAAVTGASFFVHVSEGGEPFGDSGEFLMVVADEGLTYRHFFLADVPEGTNAYSYTANEQQAEITANGVEFRYLFTNASSGIYGLVGSGGTSNGYQIGNFVYFSNSAPDTVRKKVISFKPTSATYPSALQPFRLIFNTNATYVKEVGGVRQGTGVWQYEKLNRSCRRISYLDSVMGPGKTFLLALTSKSGVYIYQMPSGQHYEMGHYSVIEQSAPRILVGPVSQSGVMGKKVAFTVVADGSAPLTYQWYKNGTPMSGATSTRLVIGNLDSTDEGYYRVRVRNPLGTDVSRSAQLTVLCGTSLDPAVVAPTASGGAHSVVVNSGGDCPWAVENTNSWITITSSTNGTGTNTVSFTVDLNTNAVPRIGGIQIGSQSLTVAQLGQPAPASIAGKTFIMSPGDGSGAFNTTNSYLLVLSTGTNNAFRIEPRGSSMPAGTGVYRYTIPNFLAGRVTFTNTQPTYSNAAFSLDFTTSGVPSYTSGNYTLTNNVDAQTGMFRNVSTGPDFNNDGYPDLLWRQRANVLVYWRFRGTVLTGTSTLTNSNTDTNWVPRTVADLNSDGSPDIIYQHATGTVAMATISGSVATLGAPLASGRKVGSNWKLVAAGDLNSDYLPDLLFQHKDGQLAVWHMNGTIFVESVFVRNGKSAGLAKVGGIADMDGDAQNDIVFQRGNKVRIWKMISSAFISERQIELTNLADGARLGVVVDFNKDGVNDVVFENPNHTVTVSFLNYGDTFNTVRRLGGSVGGTLSLVGGYK